MLRKCSQTISSFIAVCSSQPLKLEIHKTKLTIPDENPSQEEMESSWQLPTGKEI